MTSFPTPESLQQLQSDLASDLAASRPELALAGGVVLLLLARLALPAGRRHLGPFALLIAAGAFALSLAQWLAGPESREAFSGLLAYDAFAVYFRLLLTGSLVLLLTLSLLTGIPDAEDSADFATLLLGGTLGMCLMASANHLLTLFIAVEMASVPGYALAGFLKGRRQSGEAALKYVIFGAAAAGVMLYGISLIVAAYGTGSLPEVAAAVAAGGPPFMVIAGGVFVLVGVAFKLAAVPFHYWCPDVFEGASAEAAGFLSVASKAAAVALALRLAALLAAAGPDAERAVCYTLAALAGLTVTFGNLAAYGQTNLKRLLAYSTIAHAGYMLLGVAAVSPRCTAAVLFYLAAYLVMNLGAFAAVALIRNRVGSEELADYAGLMRRSPAAAVTLTLFLVSLLGLPPLAGFAAKFQLFSALFRDGQSLADAGDPRGDVLLILLAVGAVNTLLSTVYYLKVVRVMALEDGEAGPARLPGGATAFLVILAVGLFAVGLAWGPLADAATAAAESAPGAGR